jgi:hypothetical protein
MYGIYPSPPWPYKPKKITLSRYRSSALHHHKMPAPHPHPAEPDIIRRSTSTLSLRNVYEQHPALDLFLKAGPLPTLISTTEHRIAILEVEEDNCKDVVESEDEVKVKNNSPPPTPTRLRVCLADACILVRQDIAEDEIHPPLLLTASTCNPEALELGDHIRIKNKSMNVGGWVSSVSLEQPGWLVAGVHGWRQLDGEAHLTWGTFEIVTRYKWMSRNIPIGQKSPKLFRINIDRCIQTNPVTGLWGWMVVNMDSNIGM